MIPRIVNHKILHRDWIWVTLARGFTLKTSTLPMVVRSNWRLQWTYPFVPLAKHLQRAQHFRKKSNCSVRSSIETLISSQKNPNPRDKCRWVYLQASTIQWCPWIRFQSHQNRQTRIQNSISWSHLHHVESWSTDGDRVVKFVCFLFFNYLFRSVPTPCRIH